MSADDTANPDFDDAFRGEIEAATADMWRRWEYRGCDDLAINAPISLGEVERAMKRLQARLYKSPGPDAVLNWMLVWGGGASGPCYGSCSRLCGSPAAFPPSGCGRICQGVQGMPGGLHLRGMDGQMPVSLFMDDTTILSRSNAHFVALVDRYLNFCSKFRMRVNAGKSGLMLFSKDGQWRQVSLQARGKDFRSPVDKGGQPVAQRFLGFQCDPGLRISAAAECS